MYNMDIVFFIKVCDEFVTQMCSPFGMEDDKQMKQMDGMILDMEQGISSDDDDNDDVCGCNWCYLVSQGRMYLCPKRRFKLD